MDRRSILKKGRNAWRLATSARAAAIVDAEAYFTAFVEAAERARHSILILGWDIQSNVRLWRDGAERPFPAELAEFLGALTRARPGLRVRLLCWEGAIIYKFEREPNERRAARFNAQARVEFRFATLPPVGACRHEKLVVIDDAVAFAGGIDLARDRWDTPAHYARDPRRINPLGEAYRPFHDVQLIVDGGAARALGDYARDQWRCAAGQTIDPVRSESDPWPPSIPPELADVTVGISRTDPRFGSRHPIFEIQTFFEDAIRAARRSIFIECEYLTSAAVVDALARRLAEESPPEILVVAPMRASGWLEQTTMGVLRERALQRLRAADRRGRFHVYYPTVPDLGDEYIYLHSKVMVIDDHLLHVGSANLSNRSMGVDTECDLTIERTDGARALRERLLAEHLGVAPGEVRREIEARGSLVAAVEALRGAGRTLVPLAPEPSPLLDTIVPDAVDPRFPIDLVDIVADERAASRHSRLAMAKALLPWLAFIAAGLAWQLTPLRSWLDLGGLDDIAAFLQHTSAAPLLVLGAYVSGGIVFFPLNVLIVATAILFDPPASVAYALAGSLSNALVLFGIGRKLRLDFIKTLLGRRLPKLRSSLDRHGIIAIMTLRLIPIVPFSLFNLTCGGLGVRLRDYVLGTVLGLLPGILLITSVSGVVRALLEGASLEAAAALVLFLCAAVFVFYLSLRLSKMREPRPL